MLNPVSVDLENDTSRTVGIISFGTRYYGPALRDLERHQVAGFILVTLLLKLRLEAKSAAALADRDDIYTRQFGRLRAHLLPEGTPQEHLVSPFSLFLKFGVQKVIDALLALPAESEHEVRF